MTRPPQLQRKSRVSIPATEVLKRRLGLTYWHDIRFQTSSGACPLSVRPRATDAWTAARRGIAAESATESARGSVCSGRVRTHLLVPGSDPRSGVQLGRRFVPENRDASPYSSCNRSYAGHDYVSTARGSHSRQPSCKTPRRTAIADDVHQGMASCATPEEDDVLSARHPAQWRRPSVIREMSGRSI